MKKDMICVVYVDDTIICRPDSGAIEADILGLGVSKFEQRHKFELRDKGEVGDFFGIRIDKRGTGKIHLVQTVLIDKVLKVSGMEQCNKAKTPAATTNMGIDKDGEPFNDDWDYDSVVGMRMYLTKNSRPDIAFTVN